MRDSEAFLDQIPGWAGTRADVHAVVLVGSHARIEAPADEFSDLDVVLFVDDPAPYIESAEWVEAFGRPLLTFLEPTATGGQLERRVLYDSGQDVDFALVPVAVVSGLLDDAATTSVIVRGYRVLYDELGLETRLADAVHRTTEPDLAQLTHDFWYHVLWAAKKLRRGETYVAKQACDCYLKALVVELLKVGADRQRVWHDGRFLERWAPPDALAELRETYATYDAPSVAHALRATADMFARLERELGITYVDHDELTRRLDALLEP
jgi:aminoglycoside 6-adenylyltransferase